MASNIVTVSGMFGSGHTYFAGSPVVINIDGLYWGKTVTSPFTVVRLEVIYPVDTSESSQSSPSSSSSSSSSSSLSPEDAISQLNQMFPNSNAEFYTRETGYINGAAIKQITDSDNITHNALVVTSYSNMSVYDIDEYYGDLSIYTAEDIMSMDASELMLIVELDSTQSRCDTLLNLCETAYGEYQEEGDQSETVVEDDVQVVGEFRVDTGGQTNASFDISSALRAIWSDYDFDKEVAAAQSAKASTSAGASFVADTDDVNFFDENPGVRKYREYALRIYTEYLSSDDGGVFTTTICKDKNGNTIIPGGQCALGGFTEWERSIIPTNADADLSYREHDNLRNGDASTKPTESPERVGKNSITSWVDVNNSGTQSVFYPSTATPAADSQSAHAPLVLRDDQEYVDFLFLNRRGAIETCSGLTKEAMQIDVDMKQYARVGRPSFNPVRSLMAIGQDGRRSWQMSSGYVTREWAEWWAMEFLGGKRKQWWMRYPIGDPNGTYVPVIVEPAKQNISIYDRSKQNMTHVDFTVTLALEG